jgi:hypothetical protein
MVMIPTPHRPAFPLRLALPLLLGALGCGDDPVTPEPASGASEPVAPVILEGTIRRFTTDQLIGGATVRADQESVTSSERGGYVFTDLGEGEVEIRASYPGFFPYYAKQRLRAGRNRHDIELVPEGQR